MKVVIAGGTGFIGRHVQELLRSLGAEVVLLSREAGEGRVEWDGQNPGPWCHELEGADAVINLAGTPINDPWTQSNRALILSSRVNSTKAIGNAILQCQQPPRHWLNGSATGIYGDRGDTTLTESSPIGTEGFLVDVAKAWEQAAKDFVLPSTHLSILRTGIVLGRDGGAFPILSELAKRFIGSQIGAGKQFMSWVHIEDLVQLVAHIIKSSDALIWNGTAPNPVTNGEFMRQLRHAYGRPWVPPVPPFILTLNAKVGGPDPSLVTWSQNAVPAQALASGFSFQYPNLSSAIESLK